MIGTSGNPSAAAAAVHEPQSFVRSALGASSDTAFWDEVNALHDNDALLPPEHLRASATRIGSVLAIISILYMFLVLLVRAARRTIGKRSDGNGIVRRQSSSSSSATDGTSNVARASANSTSSNRSNNDIEHTPLPRVSEWKTAYQITNLAVNLYLGLLGIYHFLYTITPSSQTPPSQRVEGWENMSIFGELQIGYQLWAIPVGIFLVNEHGAMLAHHLCVIVVGAMSSFFTNGSRYFTPFFYGLIEVISVPLAVMNAFKGNPELARKFPVASQMSRLVFAISFLTVRVVMWMPQMIDYLRVAATLGFTCRSMKCRVGCAMSWWSAVGLTFLQLLWATKIVQGLLKIIFGSGKGSENKDKAV